MGPSWPASFNSEASAANFSPVFLSCHASRRRENRNYNHNSNRILAMVGIIETVRIIVIRIMQITTITTKIVMVMVIVTEITVTKRILEIETVLVLVLGIARIIIRMNNGASNTNSQQT